MYAFVTHQFSCLVVMDCTSSSRTLIDVGASAIHHSSMGSTASRWDPPGIWAAAGCDLHWSKGCLRLGGQSSYVEIVGGNRCPSCDHGIDSWLAHSHHIMRARRRRFLPSHINHHWCAPGLRACTRPLLPCDRLAYVESEAERQSGYPCRTRSTTWTMPMMVHCSPPTEH